MKALWTSPLEENSPGFAYSTHFPSPFLQVVPMQLSIMMPSPHFQECRGQKISQATQAENPMLIGSLMDMLPSKSVKGPSWNMKDGNDVSRDLLNWKNENLRLLAVTFLT